MVDLENDDENQKEASQSTAIVIQGVEDIPSLVLPIIASSSSVKSFDSHDAQSYDAAKQSTLSSSEMRQMLLDLTEKKNQLEETRLKFQQQLHEREFENQELKDRYKSLEQQHNETSR